MIQLSNWLIVYGTNRNAGKTTLITRIIKHFQDKSPVCAVKISPHFHELEHDSMILARTSDFVIVQEVNKSTGKDSARMLAAGADTVLYVQVWDNNLARVMPLIVDHLPAGSAVICESGWARNIVDPGVFLILHRQGDSETKESVARFKPLADRWIEFDGIDFDFDPDEISYKNGIWQVKKD